MMGLPRSIPNPPAFSNFPAFPLKFSEALPITAQDEVV